MNNSSTKDKINERLIRVVYPKQNSADLHKVFVLFSHLK